MAKFCGYCGSKLKDDKCPNCDNKVVEETTYNGTCGLAVTGFVFSLLSFMFGVFAIPGLICSICSLPRIKKTNEDGKGLGIAGIIISSIVLGIYIIFIFFLVMLIIGASYR